MVSRRHPGLLPGRGTPGGRGEGSGKSFRVLAPLALCFVLGAPGARSQDHSVLGYWREPGGSVIRVASCGEKVCVWIITLSRGKHPGTDTHNPDPKLRGRPLCELRIGDGFTATDPRHADGGFLYDPRSGHTYRGSMTAIGDTLKLRGYIGIRLFGRTETWTRAHRPSQTCAAKASGGAGSHPGGPGSGGIDAKRGYALESKGALRVRHSLL